MSTFPHKLSIGLSISFALLSSVFVIPSRSQTSVEGVKTHGSLAQVGADKRVPTSLCTPEASHRFIEDSLRDLPQLPIPRISHDTKSKAQTTKDLVDLVSKVGPLFPLGFNMSHFEVKGFVKGEWPLVIDYELEPDSIATLTISTENVKQPVVINLSPTQRGEVISKLPAEFGKKPQVGVLTFEAFKTGSSGREPAGFVLHALGMGDHAVGSVVIDQLHFQPENISTQKGQKASYSFHSRAYFNRGWAEFKLLTVTNRIVHVQLVASEQLNNGIRNGDSVTREWDGKDNHHLVKPGVYQFHVRMQRGLSSGGDWVFAAAEQVVRVD